MIGEMEKNNKGKSYTIEEVDEALNSPRIRDRIPKIPKDPNKLKFSDVISKAEITAFTDEFKKEASKLLVEPAYHTVYGVRFANHLTPYKIVMFKNHYILVLKATNTMNENSFIMKDLPLNDNLIARLIKNGFPTIKVTKLSEQ